MRQGFGAAFVLLALCRPAAAAPLPQRILSLKICTDELLMDLVPPSRIASISVLSRERDALHLFPQAAVLPVNHNTAEEVLAAKPDLILTDPYMTPTMRELLARSGARIVEVPDAQTFDQIRAVTRQVGDAVGARPRAEALIARMDSILRALAAAKPRRVIRVAGWGGGGFLPGRETLFNTVLAAAGGTNVAPARDGYADVEGLLAARPDVLAYGDAYLGAPSLRTDQNDHPLLLRYFAGRRIVYPSALLDCGVPQSAGAARQMRDALAAAMRNPGGVPGDGRDAVAGGGKKNGRP